MEKLSEQQERNAHGNAMQSYVTVCDTSTANDHRCTPLTVMHRVASRCIWNHSGKDQITCMRGNVIDVFVDFVQKRTERDAFVRSRKAPTTAT